jgi:hypothetical protein
MFNFRRSGTWTSIAFALCCRYLFVNFYAKLLSTVRSYDSLNTAEAEIREANTVLRLNSLGHRKTGQYAGSTAPPVLPNTVQC